MVALGLDRGSAELVVVLPAEERLFEGAAEVARHEGVDERVGGAVGVRHAVRYDLRHVNDAVGDVGRLRAVSVSFVHVQGVERKPADGEGRYDGSDGLSDAAS